jgi:hypothetical protein
MIRPVLTELVLFVTPFVAYAIFLLATRAKVLDPEAWTWRKLASLTLVALLLVLGSFIVLAQYYRPPAGTYVPAHVKDGKFIPGQVVK